MGLKYQLRRLKREASGDLERFELLDGSPYYHDTAEVHKQLFVHSYDMQVESQPEPPEVLTKICEARNPAAVLERFKPPESAFVNLTACYNTDALERVATRAV